MLPLLSLALSNVLAALALAALALLVGRCLRRPALAHALWLLVLIKLITPPLVRVEIPWPAAAPAPVPVEDTPPPAEAVEVAAPAAQPDDDVLRIDEVAAAPAAEPRAASWPGLLVGLWLTGSLGWFALVWWRAYAFSRLLRLGKAASDKLRGRVAAVAERLGVACPPVLVVPGRLAPLVWGVFRPVLVLPDGLERTVGEAGWRTIVAHELAHVRRGDPLVRGLELLVNGLYWWCPLAWLACRELREAEEQCCDAWVVRTLPEEKKAYATALIDVLDYLSEAAAPAPLCSGLGPVADLKRRLTMILNGVTPPRLGRGAGVTMLLAAAFVLPLVPGWAAAQDPKPTEAKRDVLFLLVDKDGDAKKLEEEVARKAKELEEAKRKLAESRKQQGLELTARVPAARTITIQISGVGGKPEEVEAIVKKIRELVGGDKKVTVQPLTKDMIYRYIVKGAEGQALGGPWAVPHPPGAPVAPLPPMAGLPPMARGTPPGDGKRMADLERRLEEMMQRIEEMRREMRRPGPGGAGGPGPMGGGDAPPAAVPGSGGGSGFAPPPRH